MGLDQNLADPGSASEVSIDLKGRMRVEKVGISPSFSIVSVNVGDWSQLLPDQLKRAVAIEQARPQVDLPAHRPTGGFISPVFKGLPGRTKEIGGRIRGYLVAGMQSVEVGDVPVPVILTVPILKPFLQLTETSDPHGRQTGSHGPPFFHPFGIHSQLLRRLHRI